MQDVLWGSGVGWHLSRCSGAVSCAGRVPLLDGAGLTPLLRGAGGQGRLLTRQAQRGPDTAAAELGLRTATGPSPGSCQLLLDGVIAQSAVDPVWVAVAEETSCRSASGTNRLDGGLQNGTCPAISKAAPAGVQRVDA